MPPDCPRVFMRSSPQAISSERLCCLLLATPVKPCACKCSLSFECPNGAAVLVELSCPFRKRARGSNTYGEKYAIRSDRCPLSRQQAEDGTAQTYAATTVCHWTDSQRPILSLTIRRAFADGGDEERLQGSYPKEATSQSL